MQSKFNRACRPAGALVVAALAALVLAGCDSQASRYGFASTIEMKAANAGGFLTKARLDQSMTPLVVPEFPTPPQPRLIQNPTYGQSRERVQLCGSVASCANAALAAARDAQPELIHAAIVKILAQPQSNRAGGGGRDDFWLARQIMQASLTRPAQAMEIVMDELQADPRRSGAWLGYGAYLITQGRREDAWAAVWMSWYVAKDKQSAINRIQRAFFAESSHTIKAMFGPSMTWIERGVSPFLSSRS